MKHQNYYIIALAASTLMLGGCNAVKMPFGSGSSADESKSQSTLPTDRERIHSSHPEKIFTAADLEEGVVTGDWTIEEVYGEKAVGETTPFLKMVPSEKRVYGNNGCNTINAKYTYNPAEHQLSFSELASTMRMCATPGITDAIIGEALDKTRTYSWDHEGDQYYLYFYDEAGNMIMKLMHQNFDFLNGQWHVTAIENEEIDEPEMNLVIDVDEGKIHGNTGCNILNGKLDVDMETVNTISFHDIITTRMACPNPENQTRLIVALEDAAHATPIDNNTVVLLNLLRQPVLTLKRIP
ncbi:MAG: META domain-containing protein [Muribaculaceae bacterium]|nr:META domain-containing protein [Muribaculaceae bacterium]